MSTRPKPLRYFRIIAVLMVLAMCLAPIAGTAGPAVAQQGDPPNVPYDLPVQLPPSEHCRFPAAILAAGWQLDEARSNLPAQPA